MSEQASAYLRGAIVQKVDRIAQAVFVLSVRLPSASIELVVIGARSGAAIGPVASMRKEPRGRQDGRGVDGEKMRWRKELEGARVVSLAARPDGRWHRLQMVRAGEARAIVATTEGVTLLLGAAAESTGDEAPVAAVGEAEGLAAAAGAAVVAWKAADRAARKRACVEAIARALKKIERRVEAVRGDLATIAGAEALTSMGVLLQSNGHAIPKGAREVTLDDWSSGEAVATKLVLDPSKSARQNAELFFHKSKRLKRGAVIAASRLAEAEKTRDAIAQILAEARFADDDGKLEIVEGRAKAARIAIGSPARGRAQPPPSERLPYKTFLSTEAAPSPILVGRGAKDNDALTTKHARPNDLWLHTKGWTGAHVIVPLQKGQSCAPERLIDAAHLAAHFSDARGEAVVEVQWVERRYVRKPRGAAPGAVVVEREKVVVLRVEGERLARLLASEQG